MATHVSCDRCGSSESVEPIALPLKKTIDLCRNCIRELEIWVKTPIEVKTE